MGAPFLPFKMRLFYQTSAILRQWLAQGDTVRFWSSETLSVLPADARQPYLNAKAQSSLILPLRVSDRWIGLLVFNWTLEKPFTSADERMYQALAKNAASYLAYLRQQQAAEQRVYELETIASLSTKIAGILNLETLLHEVVEEVKSAFNLYHAQIYLLEESGNMLTVAAGSGETGVQMKNELRGIALDNTLSVVAMAAREKRGIVVNDVTESPIHLPNAYLPKTRAELAVPMLVNQQVIGVLDLQSEQSGRFTELDVQLKITLANHIASAIQNARSFELASQSEREVKSAVKLVHTLQRAMDNAAMVSITDLDGTLTYVNDKFCERTGYTREELIGNNQRIINSGYHPKEYYRHMWQTIAAGHTWHGEFRNKMKDGTLYWADLTIVPSLDEHGKPYEYIGISHEITKIRDAEELSRRRAAELETVAQVSAAATTIQDVNRLLQTVSDLTKMRFNLYHAHVYLYDAESKALVLAAGAGQAGRKMKAEGHRIPMNSPISLVARAAREKQVIIVNDVFANPSFLPNPLLPETQSEMALPLVVGDTLIGVLDLQSDKLNYFTDEDVRVQSALAAQIAVAVQNARNFEQIRSTEAALRESEEIYRALARNFPNGAIVMFDHDLRYRLVDGQGLRDAGLNKAEMEGKTLWEVWPAEIAQTLEKQYVDALVGNVAVAEVPFLDQTFLQYTLPVRDTKGQVIAGMVMSQNITERKRSEQSLAESEARFRIIAETFPGVIYQFAADGDKWSAPYVSKGMKDLAGVDPEIVMADINAFIMLIHPEDLPSFQASVVRVLQTLEPWFYEGRLIRLMASWSGGKGAPSHFGMTAVVWFSTACCSM